jgi:cold shock CspA family protein
VKTEVMLLCTIRPSRATGYKSLAEGDTVSFDTENGPKGPKAINVVKL